MTRGDTSGTVPVNLQIIILKSDARFVPKGAYFISSWNGSYPEAVIHFQPRNSLEDGVNENVIDANAKRKTPHAIIRLH
jgi:hypothetical protein